MLNFARANLLHVIRFVGSACLICVHLGCGNSDAQADPDANPLTNPLPVAQSNNIDAKPAPSSEPETVLQPNTKPNWQLAQRPNKPPPDKPRILGDLLDDEEYQVRKMPVDEARVTANGIRKLSSKHLILYTDLPRAPKVDELPAVFDKAVPFWCEYFGLDLAKMNDWQMTGFLMKDEQRFINARVFPEEVRGFLHGFQRGYELWLFDQPSDYYRRHLLLHEGTHGVMNLKLGGMGPPWYAEGMAELLATHRWQDGKLTMRYNPKSKQEVPYWGRVKIINDAYAAGQGQPLGDIFQLGPTAHRRVDAYAWSWAAASFLDHHPDYQERFRTLQKQVKRTTVEFNRDFLNATKDHWVEIQEQWHLYIREMQYGYDVSRAAVAYKRGQPLAIGGARVNIDAARGWQSSGVRLEKGRTYEITASGRYQVGDQPKTWWCEPNGVTIEYFNDRPLGILVATIRDDDNAAGNSPYFSKSAAVGTGREITPSWSGTLYFKINESAARLSDNDGNLAVQIRAK